MSTINICGLTDYENQIIKEHQGECRHCMFHEGFEHTMFSGEKIPILLCTKNGGTKRLKEEKTDCEDWFPDTRWYVMSFCEGYKHKKENYCELFDDVLSFEGCVFKWSDEEWSMIL